MKVTRNGVFDSYIEATGFYNTSDRDAKDNFAAVNPRSVLRRLASVPVSTWNFKNQPEGVRHMGPMAQDFRAAFGLGRDDKRMATVDAQGVALAAIQGLYELVQEKDKQIGQLRARVGRLERGAGRRRGSRRAARR